MKHVPPRFSRDEALHMLSRRRFERLRRLLTMDGSGQRARARFRRIDRVWMPWYLVPFEVNSRKGPGTITVSVEGWSGAFAIFEMHDDVRDDDIHDEWFLPRLSENDAIHHGRENLIHTILRQPSRGSKPVVGAPGHVTVLFYPFWVYYYERRRGLLDVKILDAVTGLPAGGKIKGGILEAFKAKSRQTESRLDANRSA